MWRPDRSRLIRLRLHAGGERAEAAWAEDCGPAPAPPGARFARIASIPFVYAKPTYEDVVVAVPEPGRAHLGWDAGGLAYDAVAASLMEDARRWTAILDYHLPDPATDADAALAALEGACAAADIAVERCCAPWNGEPGRVYLAVPGALAPEEVLTYLDGEALPLTWRLVHPRAHPRGA